MQPSLDNKLHAKKLRYQLILCRDIDDQRMLQSDWMRGTIAHTQTKVLVPGATFFDDYLDPKNLRYRLIPSRDINDQRILQSGWMEGTNGHTQPKVTVSGTTFLY